MLVLLALFALGCSNKKKDPAGPDAPPFVLKDDTQGLMLTWIDEKGEFHTEMNPKDVPIVGRDAVRVVDPTKDEGTHDSKVFIADMRTPKPDGTYPIKVMTKPEFDQLAVARRQKHGPTLADAPDSGAVAPTNTNPTSDPPPSNVNLGAVIIYGASWCGPCHEAAAYLRRKGITYVEKDIETDAAAAKEMKTKLTRAGYPSGSIPVIDVRGKILVGFNPRAVDEALGRAT
jgi:glutaredoxin